MITLSTILLLSAATAPAPSQPCKPVVIENSGAIMQLLQLTQLIHVRPNSPDVPDNDPNTVQLMTMDSSDTRPSHVSKDGQVIYFHQEAVRGPCNATLLHLLDESYGKRLRLLQGRDGA